MASMSTQYSTTIGPFSLSSYLGVLGCNNVDDTFDGNIFTYLGNNKYRFTVIDAAVNKTLEDTIRRNHEGLEDFKRLLREIYTVEAANMWLDKHHDKEAEYKHLNPLLAFTSLELNLELMKGYVYKAADCEIFIQYKDGTWEHPFGDFLTSEGRAIYNTAHDNHEKEHGKYNAPEIWWDTQNKVLNDMKLFRHPTLGLESMYLPKTLVLDIENVNRIVLTTDGVKIDENILDTVDLKHYLLKEVHNGEHCQHADFSALDIVFF